jgi:hypothetical protein
MMSPLDFHVTSYFILYANLRDSRSKRLGHGCQAPIHACMQETLEYPALVSCMFQEPDDAGR